MAFDCGIDRTGGAGEYDRFAARLLLVAMLLRRRAVMPPIECSLPYMRKALQARHLRGMEVGCGPLRQCVWLPYPHHIDPWCAGVDFLYDVDYQVLAMPSRPPMSKTISMSMTTASTWGLPVR